MFIVITTPLAARKTLSWIPCAQIQPHISQQEMSVSPHRSRVVSYDTFTLCPALIPSGLCVILKPVVYELVLYILHTDCTVMFTPLQLFVDGRSTLDGCTGVPFSPAFALYKYSI